MFDYVYGAFIGALISLVCLPPTFVLIVLLPRQWQDFKLLFPLVYACFLCLAAAAATVISIRYHFRKILKGLWIAFALAFVLDLLAGITGLAWYRPYR